jgi:putative ABC transport system permease protein
MLLSAIHLDLTAVVVSVTLAFAVGIAFGLVPAAHASRADLAASMRGDSTTPTRRAPSDPLRGRELLVVAEVGLAFALILAATLLGRSLRRELSIDPGFNPRGLLTARLSLPNAVVSADSLPSFSDELLRQIAAVPGVTSAALVDCPPLSGGCSATFPGYLDRVDPPNGLPLVGVHYVSPSYFATLGAPVYAQRNRAVAAVTDAIHAARNGERPAIRRSATISDFVASSQASPRHTPARAARRSD